MVSLFLSTALIISTIGCGPQQQIVNDQAGNPSTIEEDDDSGFFGWFMAPLGFSKKRSSGIRANPSGITSGGSSVNPNFSGAGSSTPNNKTGISSGGSSSNGGTGITSGTHGGIGGGGSSAS